MDLPATMLAAVLYGFNDVRLEERRVPSPGPDEALVKIAACGVCAGDIKIITKGMPKQPPFGEFIIGHEYAGTLVALGEAIDEFNAGDRVAVEVHKGCGRCRNCIMGKYTACLNYGNQEKGHRANGFTTNGGFAEYAVNHVNTLCKLPDSISFDEATTVTTAGTSLYGIDMAGGYIPGDSVAVLGPGSVGLMAVQCCKALGAGKVILNGTRAERLELGKRLGADHVVNVKDENPVEKVRGLTGGLGADLVLVAADQEGRCRLQAVQRKQEELRTFPVKEVAAGRIDVECPQVPVLEGGIGVAQELRLVAALQVSSPGPSPIGVVAQSDQDLRRIAAQKCLQLDGGEFVPPDIQELSVGY